VPGPAKRFAGAAHEEDTMTVVEPVKRGLSADSEAIATAASGRLASGASVSRLAGCRASCAFGGATERHHRRLKAIEHDPEAVLELMELAITWPELEYSEADVIPPESWGAFVNSHRWADLNHVRRIFGLAIDIVRAATRRSQHVIESSDCLFAMPAGTPHRLDRRP
jgi:hypothetical protein